MRRGTGLGPSLQHTAYVCFFMHNTYRLAAQSNAFIVITDPKCLKPKLTVWPESAAKPSLDSRLFPLNNEFKKRNKTSQINTAAPFLNFHPHSPIPSGMK